MKNTFAVLLSLLLLFSLVGCSNSESESGLADLYIQVFSDLLDKDPALNSDIKFIAIDFNTVKDLSKEDKDKIIEYFKKDNIEIKDASLEDLKESGLFDDQQLYIKDGILLKVDKYKEYTKKRIMLEASKYRSGTGAIGVEYSFKKKWGKWALIEARGIWIS